jgi:hypothetical protein
VGVDARVAQAGQHRLAIGAQGVDAEGGLRWLVAGRQQRSRIVGAELAPPHLGQPERRRVGRGGDLRGRVVTQQRLDQRVALAARPAQHGIDETGCVWRSRALDQLHCLINGSVVGRGIGEEQLVDAQSQPREDGRVEVTQRPVDEPLQRGVDRSASLHRAEGEPLRLASLAAVQLGLIGCAAKGPLGGSIALEARADCLEGKLPRRRDRAPAHSFSGEWPRR